MTTNQSIENATAKTQAEGRGVSLLMSHLAGLFFAIGLLGFLFLPGCATPPTTEQIDATVEAVTNSQAFAELVAYIKDKETRDKIIEAIEKEEIPQIADSEEDAVPYSTLNFTYGGIKGSTCVLVKNARIEKLTVNNTGMIYRWKTPGCKELGAADDDKAFKGISACVFVKNAAGQWVGGRFDAISTSRTSRSFKNITGEQYRGWRRDEFLAATEVLFVIISDDCRWRTNVIKGEK